MRLTKNVFFIISFIVLVIAIIIIFLFSNHSKANTSISGEELIYDFGIISTIAHMEKSVISYYKFDGELVKRQKLKLAWLGMGFGSFGETDEFVYTKVDNKNGTVFELNKKTGDVKLYDLAYNSLTMYADDNYVYYANSSTEKSTISKFNPSNEELKELEMGKTITLAVYPYKENIYVSSLNRDMSAYIYILDKDTLEIKEKIYNDVSSGHNHIYGVGDKVYFANNRAVNDMDGSNILSEYDITSNEFNTYELDYEYLYDIHEYKGTLIITHVEIPGRLGNRVTVFDLKTKEIKGVALENNLEHSTIKDDLFISMDGEYAYIYSLPDFKLLNKIYTDVDGYYETTLFTK